MSLNHCFQQAVDSVKDRETVFWPGISIEWVSKIGCHGPPPLLGVRARFGRYLGRRYTERSPIRSPKR